MKLNFKYLIILFLLLLSGFVLIKTALAIDESRFTDPLSRRSSLTTNGPRAWKVVTLAENIGCGATSQAIEVGDYANIRPFAFKLSPDGSNWAYSPLYISYEGGGNGYLGGNDRKEIEGPYYRVRTEHQQNNGGEAKGNFKVMAYIYSD